MKLITILSEEKSISSEHPNIKADLPYDKYREVQDYSVSGVAPGVAIADLYSLIEYSMNNKDVIYNYDMLYKQRNPKPNEFESFDSALITLNRLGLALKNSYPPKLYDYNFVSTCVKNVEQYKVIRINPLDTGYYISQKLPVILVAAIKRFYIDFFNGVDVLGYTPMICLGTANDEIKLLNYWGVNFRYNKDVLNEINGVVVHPLSILTEENFPEAYTLSKT